LRAGLEEMIEQERAGLRGDPEQEAKAWLEALSEVDQERRGYLRLAAKGHMSDEELDETLSELEDTRQTAEKELEAVRARREILEALERDKDALLESYAEMTPGARRTKPRGAPPGLQDAPAYGRDLARRLPGR
jgi:multidrug resistance efflux pump